FAAPDETCRTYQELVTLDARQPSSGADDDGIAVDVEVLPHIRARARRTDASEIDAVVQVRDRVVAGTFERPFHSLRHREYSIRRPAERPPVDGVVGAIFRKLPAAERLFEAVHGANQMGDACESGRDGAEHGVFLAVC